MASTKHKNQDDQIIALYQAGASMVTIALQTGYASVATVGRRIAKLVADKKLVRRTSHPARRGSNHGRAVFSEQTARQAILKRLGGTPYSEIAKVFDVDESTVRALCIGKTWPHIYQEHREGLEEVISRKPKK